MTVTKWEYWFYHLPLGEEDFEMVFYKQLNQLGSEGWELVTTVLKMNDWLILKRPVS